MLLQTILSSIGELSQMCVILPILMVLSELLLTILL